MNYRFFYLLTYYEHKTCRTNTIQYTTNGRQVDFAEMMEWTPQYVYKLLKEGSMGIKTVASLLETFPNLNARWLILGEGNMIIPPTDMVKRQLLQLLEIEKYIPVMTKEELQEMSTGCRFNQETIDKWEMLLKDYNKETLMQVRASMQRQGLCNQNTAE